MITVNEVGFDRFVKQGGKDSITVFNTVMRYPGLDHGVVVVVDNAQARVVFPSRGGRTR